MCYTKNIVCLTGFLIGIPYKIIEEKYQDTCKSYIEGVLDKHKEANIVRDLCMLRTALMVHYKDIDTRLRYDLTNIDKIEKIPQNAVKALKQAGIGIIITNGRAANYNTLFNKLINEHIDNCRDLYPDWVDWEIIRNLFVYKGYQKNTIQKREFKKFKEESKKYPNLMYINWEPVTCGDLLADDYKFLSTIYNQHKMELTSELLCKLQDKQVSNAAVEQVNNFVLDTEDKCIVVVDCENSDVYKLYTMLVSLADNITKRISKILLFDDPCTNNGWDMLNNYSDIPVEHVEVSRLVEQKSLVDVRMAAGICKEFYQNGVNRFILVASDSDYWGVIPTLEGAKFLVVGEEQKFGAVMKRTLNEHNIVYCNLDDFANETAENFKQNVINNEINVLLNDALKKIEIQNVIYNAFKNARIRVSDVEVVKYIERYTSTATLQISEKQLQVVNKVASA